MQLFEDTGVLTMNKKYEEKQAAYSKQQRKYGGLSKDAQKKLSELIKKYDPINNTSLRPTRPNQKSMIRDGRLPIPGSLITREYKGKWIEVKVLEKGFEFEGQIYRSLTAITKKITGANWNGFEFFSFKK